MNRVVSYQSRQMARAGLLSLSILLSGGRDAVAAKPALPVRAAAAPAADVMGDLRLLAQQRPKRCGADEPAQQAPGWRATAVECAWQGRLQMRRWSALPAAGNACVSRAALWWQWQQARTGIAAPAAWDAAWPAQGLSGISSGRQRLAVIEKSAGGAWTASDWTWNPSPRAATRQWQMSRWELLATATAKLRPAVRGAAGAEAVALRTAWEANLRGRAGEMLADAWLWESNGLCMRMETAGLSQAQLHLPYSRDEVRHEQRAAMQLQLARRFPRATWLTPFRLVSTPAANKDGGAKYEAIWLEDGLVKGQLWMPTKTDGAIVRARIVAVFPVEPGGRPPGPAVANRRAAIERELAGLAAIWEAEHE